MRKRLAVLLLAGLMSLSACSPASGTASEGENSPSQLTVYYIEGNPSVQQILTDYQAAFPEVEVEVVGFEKSADMDARLTTELSAGYGPDVVLFTPTTTLDTLKMAENGSFLDLTEKLSSDGEFKKEDYYDIFDAGQIEGKQYLMPLGFRVPYLLTTEEKLSEAGAEVDSGQTLEGIFGMISQTAEKNDSAHSAAHCLYQITPASVLYDQLRLTNVDILDYKNKEMMVEKDIFQKYADDAKLLYGQYEKSLTILKEYSRDLVGAFSKVTFFSSRDQIGFNARYYDSIFEQGLGQDMKLLMYPNQDNPAGRSADIILYGGITSGSENVEEGYQLLRIALDCNYGVSSEDLPMKKENVKAIVEDLCKNKGKQNVSIGVKSVSIDRMDEELGNEIIEQLNNLSHGSISNQGILGIMEDTMTDYITGSKDFDSCYCEMENKIQLYLYE